MQLDWLKFQTLAKTTPKLIALRNVKTDKWLWVHKDFQK